MRKLLLAFGLGLAVSAHAVGVPGLNESRDQLALEFKGAVVRCKVDILRATPAWSWDVMTTGTPKGVVYPNHTQPVAFETRSLVQLREFDVRNGGIRVVVTTPGFDLKRMGRVGWDALDWTGAGRADRHREIRETRSENVQCVFIIGDDVRAALQSLFAFADEAPGDDDVRACLARHAEAPRAVAESLCGMTDASAIAFGGLPRQPRMPGAPMRVAYVCGDVYHAEASCPDCCENPRTIAWHEARGSNREFCRRCRDAEMAAKLH
jgi:hypothetical protein